MEFGAFWMHFEAFWGNLAHFCTFLCISGILVHFGAFWRRLVHCGVFWMHSEAFREHSGGNFVQFGCNLRHFGALWGQSGAF